MIKRILAPTDGSPESDRALSVIENLAAAQDAEVLLVQVVDFPTLVDNDDLVWGESAETRDRQKRVRQGRPRLADGCGPALDPDGSESRQRDLALQSVRLDDVPGRELVPGR